MLIQLQKHAGLLWKSGSRQKVYETFTRLCLGSSATREAASVQASSHPSWHLWYAHAPVPSQAFLVSLLLTCRGCAFVDHLFHFPSPYISSPDSLAIATSQPCFAQPAEPYAYRKLWNSRKESNKPEWSFWFHPSLWRGGSLALRSLSSFIESTRQRLGSRALLWWGRCQSLSPVFLATSYRALLAGWWHQVW